MLYTESITNLLYHMERWNKMSAEKTYTVNLTMTVTQTEINAALQDYKNTPNENPTLLEIITDDIQRFGYRDWETQYEIYGPH